MIINQYNTNAPHVICLLNNTSLSKCLLFHRNISKSFSVYNFDEILICNTSSKILYEENFNCYHKNM